MTTPYGAHRMNDRSFVINAISDICVYHIPNCENRLFCIFNIWCSSFLSLVKDIISICVCENSPFSFYSILLL